MSSLLRRNMIRSLRDCTGLKVFGLKCTYLLIFCALGVLTNLLIQMLIFLRTGWSGMLCLKFDFAIWNIETRLQMPQFKNSKMHHIRSLISLTAVRNEECHHISWIGIICLKQVLLCLQSPRGRESQQWNEPKCLHCFENFQNQILQQRDWACNDVLVNLPCKN